MRVLFICTANSCRSQIAETWARHLFPGDWEVRSAGLITCGITSDTRRTMTDAGLTMTGQHSKSIDEFDLDAFDLVVTLSDESGRFLPTLERPERHVHRPLTDPMGISGAEEKIHDAFRQARDEIRGVVEQIVSGEIGVFADHGGS